MPETETVPCPLCGEMRTKSLFGRDGWVLGRCVGCGLVRQNPRWTAAALVGEHYENVVFDDGRLVSSPQAYEGLEPWQPQPLDAYARGVEAVDRHRRRTGPKGTWVDVGASTGSLLLAAREAGWPVRGVEPGRRQAAFCREQHGLDVVHGTLPDARFEDDAMEVVSYRHVFEHVHDLDAELREVRRILAPDGLLLLEVPNFGGQRFLWGRLRTTLRLCKPFYRRLNLPEHLYYFTTPTLVRLLEARGFDVLYRATYGRTRQRPGLFRRTYDALRDRVGLGNNLRVVAAPR